MYLPLKGPRGVLSALRADGRAWDVYEAQNNVTSILRNVAPLYRTVVITGLDAWIADEEWSNIEDRFDKFISATAEIGRLFITLNVGRWTANVATFRLQAARDWIFQRLYHASRYAYITTRGAVRRIK
ncbi:MAG: hypothetical protein ACKER6_01010 [Candidatus Hodgkinia cicadicola]